MGHMEKINIRSFKQKARHHKKAFSRFLGKIEKNPPRALHRIVSEIDKEVWAETDCLSCANCCKTMTPTFTGTDIRRISAHLGMGPAEFKSKWLHFEEKDKDWVNNKQPCQFLNLKDNKCSVYAVRPSSCAGFPHLTKKKMVDYIHVHQQNVEYCPATYKMVEKMMERLIKK